MYITDLAQDLYDSGVYLVQNYGWYLLIGCIVLIYVYNKYIESLLAEYRKRRFEQEYAAKYHKNPDLFSAHISAQQAFVQKLQEKYNEQSLGHQEKLKEREEKKRQETIDRVIDKYGPAGNVLGDNKTDTSSTNKKTSLRPENNPLMGGGSSSTYRPPRRSPCSGGGCGR